MIQEMLYFLHANHVDFYLRGAMKCKKSMHFFKNHGKIIKSMMRQLFNTFCRRQVEKSLNLNWYITINLQHDARQEWLISMQTSMDVFFSR